MRRGEPVRLVSGPAFNPVWSPDGSVIVYAGAKSAVKCTAAGCGPGRQRGQPAGHRGRDNGERVRFLPNGRGWCTCRVSRGAGFLAARSGDETTRQLTRLTNRRRHANVRYHTGRKTDRVRSFAREFRHPADRFAQMTLEETLRWCLARRPAGPSFQSSRTTGSRRTERAARSIGVKRGCSSSRRCDRSASCSSSANGTASGSSRRGAGESAVHLAAASDIERVAHRG